MALTPEQTARVDRILGARPEPKWSDMDMPRCFGHRTPARCDECGNESWTYTAKQPDGKRYCRECVDELQGFVPRRRRWQTTDDGLPF